MTNPKKDSVPILRCSPHLRMAKTWQRDGRILSYNQAKYFEIDTVGVENLHDLSRLLSKLEVDPQSCIIRGQYIGEEKAQHIDNEHRSGKVRRIGKLFEDVPRHWLMIEIDQYEPSCDPIDNPVEAIEEFIENELPECFFGISFHWQLSNRAGHPSKKGELRVHLWFWLESSYTSKQLKAWAKNNNLKIDSSVFHVVQIHYTAAPVFEEGVADPVQQRSGFYEGILDEVASRQIDDRQYSKQFIDNQKSEKATSCDRAMAIRALRAIPNDGSDFDDRKDWLNVVMAAKSAGVPKDIVENWTKQHPSYDKKKFDSDWNSIKEDKPDGLGPSYLFHIASRYEFFEHIEAGFDNLEESKKEALFPALRRDKDGRIFASIENVTKAIGCSVFCEQEIGFDQFRDQIVIRPYKITREWRSFTDEDYTRLTILLENKGFKEIKRERIRDAVRLVAKNNSFDSAIELISGLEWDGVERIDTFLPKYLGAATNEYTRAVSRYIWTALAGRVLEPGIKADMVPILIGEQGSGKSSSVAAMVPSPEFFTEISLNERDDDLSRKMRGCLIAEMGELRGMSTKDQDHLKAFITRNTEKWVPKFKEFSTSYPRRCLLIGTTNREQFLTDETGNRRWLPVNTGKTDVEAIKKDCLQLWAEAKIMFTDFGILFEGAERLVRGIHADHMEIDELTPLVLEWLNEEDCETNVRNDERDYFTISDVIRGIWPCSASKADRRLEMRIAKILKNLGFKRDKDKRINGTKIHPWVKVR